MNKTSNYLIIGIMTQQQLLNEDLTYNLIESYFFTRPNKMLLNFKLSSFVMS
jgi:hypothetical protein